MSYISRLSGTIRRLVDAMPFTENRNTKINRKKYAADFVNRVLKAVGSSDNGQLARNLVPKFDSGEADLMDFTLRTLCDCGILRREIRYFTKRTPEA